MEYSAGGEELKELSHELAEFARTDAAAKGQLAEAAHELEAEAEGMRVEQLPPQYVEAERKYTDQLPPADGGGKQ